MGMGINFTFRMRTRREAGMEGFISRYWIWLRTEVAARMRASIMRERLRSFRITTPRYLYSFTTGIRFPCSIHSLSLISFSRAILSSSLMRALEERSFFDFFGEGFSSMASMRGTTITPHLAGPTVMPHVFAHSVTLSIHRCSSSALLPTMHRSSAKRKWGQGGSHGSLSVNSGRMSLMKREKRMGLRGQPCRNPRSRGMGSEV